jgi:hypothetical protein
VTSHALVPIRPAVVPAHDRLKGWTSGPTTRGSQPREWKIIGPDVHPPIVPQAVIKRKFGQ